MTKPTPLTDAMAQAGLTDALSEIEFYRTAPQRFFAAWHRAARLAGPNYFGDGTAAGHEAATDKWQLKPQLDHITFALTEGGLSHGEKVFLATLYCFFDDGDGKTLCKLVGVDTLGDLTILDLDRRRIIADLLVNYSGW
jgi:hypothetical protein